jgi:transposase
MEISIMDTDTLVSNYTIQLDRPILSALCIGIDLHKDSMMICVLDPRTDEQTFTRIACKCRGKIVEFFKSLKTRGPIVVAIETVGFHRWLFELLYPIVDRLVLADATQCRAMAGRRIKTDQEDSLNVAQILAAGRLPIAYAPPAQVYELRDWTRHRNFLSRQRARCIHRIKSLMNLNNRPGPQELTTASLHRYLEGTGPLLPERHVLQLWQAHQIMGLLDSQIGVAERQLRRCLGREWFARTYRILDSIKGVGDIVAATVIAEIGDFHRFDDAKAIVKYSGLNPRVYNSADTVRTGRIQKAGPRDLRWVLQQAAWTAIRCDPGVKKLFLKIARKAGRKKAAVAIARKMLGWMWKMVLDGTEYQSKEERRVVA